MIREEKSNAKTSRYTVLLAGLAGGTAEVVWLAGYSAVSGVDGWQVAREITAAVAPAWGRLAVAPLIGLGIHFFLSILLAVAFRIALSAPYLRGRTIPGALLAGPVALAGIWAINFFVVLPVLDPAFVHILPFSVSLGSKILFGLAMSGVLLRGESVALRLSRLRHVAGSAAGQNLNGSSRTTSTNDTIFGGTWRRF